jgi:OFA family oxalate/formate antiporter-like MFS transporter
VSAAFAVLGILYMIVILPMTFFIKEPPVYFSQTLARTRNGTNSAVDGAAHKDSSQSDYTAKQMLCSPVFYVLLLVLTFGASAGLMIMGHASSILQDRLNIDIVKAAFIIGFISMSNAAGRLLFGTISDKIGRMTILSVLFVIIMFSMAALIYADGIIFILAMMLTGSCYGGFASMFSPLTADFFGTKYLKINFAFMYIAYGLAGILGPQLAVSAKKSGGYNLAFVYVIALCAAGFCMSMGLSLYSKRTGNLRTRP